MSEKEAGIPQRMTLSLETSKKLGALAKKEYSQAREYKEMGKPLIWSTVAGPLLELLRGFDVACLYPENNGAATAAAGIAPQCIDYAVDMGFPRDMCSYFTINCGFVAGAKDRSDLRFPAGGLPPPDMLIADSTACVHRVIWFRVIQRLLNIPMFTLDMPFFVQRMTWDRIDDHVLEYLVSQMKELISFVEEHTGQKFDEQRLKEAARLSYKSQVLFGEACDLAKRVPCPFSVEDVAHILRAIGGYDPLDSTSVNVPVPDYAALLQESIKGFKLGLPKEYFIEGIDPEVDAAVKNAIEVLESIQMGQRPLILIVAGAVKIVV